MVTNDKPIQIVRTPNADSRSADHRLKAYELEDATEKHIEHVRAGLMYFAERLNDAGWKHDYTKLAYSEEFTDALNSGRIKDSKWYEMHCAQERHHLLTKAPGDVNLIDVMEHITDCVMAGLARSGDVYDVIFPDDLLQHAVANTVELLKSQVGVSDGN